ncbi:hypothetical protein DEJ49_33520 [Streptomyces venezuelae]|uniref:Prohead serine protease domain-containing protein n=1 Tax=Streptomyces venezuelae TaxID=54571 RepID=A0A5P2CSJ3_STRVZ|nr:HK97 family phage prohead protease [Streptomyces venezuelae]QES45260.1 hypothetical protein DEJ49_33520 [Streptomyces venezuelae]
MDKKSVRAGMQIKDAAKGEVTAVFSTFDVKDKDGDVTLPGAFQDGAEVVVSAYGHTSWGGALPVGKGVIRTTKSEAVADMQFFMDTQHGRDSFFTVRELAKSGLGEWSYGFDIVEADHGTFDGEEVRYLKALKVHEVSPVMVGAGVNTRTLGVKSQKDGPGGGSSTPYRSAIRPHETAATALPWDEMKTVNELPSTAPVSDLRSVYAWVDPSGDPESKSDYRIPHHMGIGGEANVRACLAGIASLNGAPGGVSIPEADRRGVYNHLASHLNDAGREVPELRSSPGDTLKFADELAAGLVTVSALKQRARAVLALRVAKGRAPLSAAASDLLEWIHDELRDLTALIDTPQEDAAREYVRFLARNRHTGD